MNGTAEIQSPDGYEASAPGEAVQAAIAGTGTKTGGETVPQRQNFAQGVVARLAGREREAAQATMLRTLSTLSMWPVMKLTGGAALHGVYLHRRRFKDLDFELARSLVEPFAEELAASGLPIRRDSPQRFLMDVRGGALRSLVVGFEVFAQAHIALPAVNAMFVCHTGEEISVYVPTLSELLLIKVGCLHRRVRALDFADLWMGLRSVDNPEILVQQMRQILNEPRWDCGSFTPDRPFRLTKILTRLGRLENDWSQELARYLDKPPTYAEVAADLARYLPALE